MRKISAIEVRGMGDEMEGIVIEVVDVTTRLKSRELKVEWLCIVSALQHPQNTSQFPRPFDYLCNSHPSSSPSLRKIVAIASVLHPPKPE